jgi:hypothetical protein
VPSPSGAQGLRPAQDAAHQLSLDPAADQTRAAEAAARARARFGPTAARPTTLAESHGRRGPVLR